MEVKLRFEAHESYQAYNRDECAKQHEVTRYADDCIILIGSSKAADRVMLNVSKFIEKKLGLKVNMPKSKVSKPNDIKYLGFDFFYG